MQKKNSLLKEVLSLVAYFIFLLCAWLLLTHFFTTATVDGRSMDPNLYNNETMLVLKQAKVRHNSVIVFNANGEDPTVSDTDYYVKRVIGLPGDKIAFRNGKLYINNKVADQSFISKDQLTNGTQYHLGHDNIKNWDISSLSHSKWIYNRNQTVVPKGKYFVLGDNREISNDSRFWGFVDKDKVMGVAKIFPWSDTKQKQHNINDLSY